VPRIEMAHPTRCHNLTSGAHSDAFDRALYRQTDTWNATRLRRRIPSLYFDSTTVTPSPSATSSSSDVVSVRIQTFHVRSHYDLADGFEAIAQVARPGTQAAAFISGQYRKGQTSNATRDGEEALQAIGSSFDSLSLFLPHVWILKSVGNGASIIAKSLRNQSVTASDMLDVNSAYKGVTDLVIQHSLLVRTELNKTPGRTNAASEKSSQAAPLSLPTLSATANVLPPRRAVPQANQGMPIVIADGPLLEGHTREDIGEDVVRDVVEHMQEHIAEHTAEHKAEHTREPIRKVVTLQKAPPLAIDDNVAEGGALRDSAPGGVRGDTAIGEQHGLKSDLLKPARYVTIGQVPLLRQADSSGHLVWQAPPLAWYRANIIDPAGGDTLFSVGEQDYVSIEGAVYAVRDIADASLQVFNPADVALPPLPVEARAGKWRFMTISENSIVDRRVLGIEMNPSNTEDSDGFIRINNKKYLMLQGEVIETDRSTIVGEARIASSAHRIMEWLPTSDAAGFIRWRDGKVMIEGHFGYYAMRYDMRLGMVVDDVAGVPVPVHYDASRAQWNIGASPESLAWRRALYGRHSDLARQGYPDEWESASWSLRSSTSESAESLQDWAQATDFPFMRHWPRLALALSKSFNRLASMSLSRPNRLSAAPRSQHFDMVHSIDGIRRCAYRLMPDIDVWESLSVVVRQEKAAAYTWDVYKGFHAIGLTMEMNLGVQALCSEMTELMMVQATRHLRSSKVPFLRKHNRDETAFLEIQIKEQVPLGRTGRAHVTLMAFKSRDIMEAGFGAVGESFSVPPSANPPALKEMSDGEFRAFAYRNRREILLIDPWGPRKIIDFAMAGGVDSAMSELLLNLKEARFGDFAEIVGYSVQAFVPPRGGTARGTRLNSVEEQG